MHGININTKGTIIVFLLLVAEGCALMQSVLDAGQSAVSQCGFPFSVQGTHCGEEPASPEIHPSASFCSHHDPIKLNQASRSHLKKGEQMPLWWPQ